MATKHPAFDEERARMVETQLAGRGISDPRVLDAFRAVPRELFVAPELAEFAYRDAPLPIAHKQTISQPYIVAVTTQALELKGGERVLEIGTGSGYAAAILGQLASEVVTIERHAPLADQARARLQQFGHGKVEVVHGDGTLGWPARAPYDAIAVAAGGPQIPRALLEQLAPGGRLVIPVGPADAQVLTRVRRTRDGAFQEEPLLEVRFVPLVGDQGWPADTVLAGAAHAAGASVSTLIREAAEPFDAIDSCSLDALLERIGSARLVLLGESTHGTSEFYRMRAHITKALIQRRGFHFVAVEADWPDAARIDDHVLGHRPRSPVDFRPFSRFPAWMWRNEEVNDFIRWLRDRNLGQPDPADRVGFHGLDLYSLFTSIAAVLAYLDDVDPDAARIARARYGGLTPWQRDPAAYGKAVLVGGYASWEGPVVAMLGDMLRQRLAYAEKDGERFFDAAQNARVVAAAENYYRTMYYGSTASWNLRDQHMFDTLQSLFAFYGPGAKGIVWEHNSHVGVASATDMSARGELNVGQLCRAAFQQDAYVIGFGTDRGSVAAASDWGAPMRRMRVRPSHPESYERQFHDSGVPAFLLHLRSPRRRAVRDELGAARLERAIGVVYRPETELASHYFQARLPEQFDEYVWFDETFAIEPLAVGRPRGGDVPDTYPFGL